MADCLLGNFSPATAEAGCDEAGRGCLAGPVFAAAVILPSDLDPELAAMLRDSKKLSPQVREMLRVRIEKEVPAWSVAQVDHALIDKINILRASIMAMHKALKTLKQQPEFILVDGNRFMPFKNIPHQCIVKGDDLYLSIAAASILAKTHRDQYMRELHELYPVYGWNTNKGYPTLFHRQAIADNGLSPYHRLSFKVGLQLTIDYETEQL